MERPTEFEPATSSLGRCRWASPKYPAIYFPITWRARSPCRLSWLPDFSQGLGRIDVRILAERSGSVMAHELGLIEPLHQQADQRYVQQRHLRGVVRQAVRARLREGSITPSNRSIHPSCSLLSVSSARALNDRPGPFRENTKPIRSAPSLSRHEIFYLTESCNARLVSRTALQAAARVVGRDRGFRLAARRPACREAVEADSQCNGDARLENAPLRFCHFFYQMEVP